MSKKIKFFPKGNRQQKELTKKEHEDMVVNNANMLIAQFRKAFHEKTEELKKNHLKEVNELKRKYKKAKIYGFISVGLFVIQAIFTLIMILNGKA